MISKVASRHLHVSVVRASRRVPIIPKILRAIQPRPRRPVGGIIIMLIGHPQTMPLIKALCTHSATLPEVAKRVGRREVVRGLAAVAGLHGADGAGEPSRVGAAGELAEGTEDGGGVEVAEEGFAEGLGGAVQVDEVREVQVAGD